MNVTQKQSSKSTAPSICDKEKKTTTIITIGQLRLLGPSSGDLGIANDVTKKKNAHDNNFH